MNVIEKGDADEILDMEKAIEVGQTLDAHYPEHPWMVTFQGGVLTVRHKFINEVLEKELGRSGFCFCIKHRNSFSASDLAQSAMLAGGQMLEAFQMPRGKFTPDRMPVVPSHWKWKETAFQ